MIDHVSLIGSILA